jgi:hypothetical protein
MIRRIKPLPLAVVLQGSEAKQQTEQNISSKVENEQIYFSSIVIGKAHYADESSGKTRLTRLDAERRTFQVRTSQSHRLWRWYFYLFDSPLFFSRR